MSVTMGNEQIVDADDYFFLAARVWNSKIEDYSSLEDASTAIKYFNEYPNAEQSYHDGGLSDFPELKGKDIKLDLIHVRFGINRLVLSRMVI